MHGDTSTAHALLISDTIIRLATQSGPTKSISPSEVARNLVGSNEKEWRLMMKPIRAIAVDLAHQNMICIKRKGKVVDPDNFKGVYRISIMDNLA